MRWLLADHAARSGVEVPAVGRAQHLAEFRPRLERRQASVCGDESLTAPHKCQQLSLLLLVDRHVAMAEKENAVDVAQTRAAACRGTVGLLCLIENDVRVGTNVGVPQARLVSQSLDKGQRVRGEGMLRLTIARIGPGKDGFAYARLRASTSAAALRAFSATGGRCVRGQHQRDANDHDQHQRRAAHASPGRQPVRYGEGAQCLAAFSSQMISTSARSAAVYERHPKPITVPRTAGVRIECWCISSRLPRFEMWTSITGNGMALMTSWIETLLKLNPAPLISAPFTSSMCF